MAADKTGSWEKPSEEKDARGQEDVKKSGRVEPLDFTIGPGEVSSKEERAEVEERISGSKVLDIISGEDGGPYRRNLVVEVARTIFPQGQQPEPDQKVLLHLRDGEKLTGRILAVSGDTVTLDTGQPQVERQPNLDILLAEIN